MLRIQWKAGESVRVEVLQDKRPVVDLRIVALLDDISGLNVYMDLGALNRLMRDGAQVESRTIGRESGFGLLHALGSRVSYERMMIQVAGRAWRLPVGALEAGAAASHALTRHIVRHAQATLIQSVQATACTPPSIV